MQPRRDTDRQAAAGAGFGAPAEDDFESVKPVGYEARLAFERERAAEAGKYRPVRPAASPAGGQATANRPGPYVPPRRMYQINARPPVQPAGGQIPAAPRPAQPTGGQAPVPLAGTQRTGEQPAFRAQVTEPSFQPVPPPVEEDPYAERSPELMERKGDFWKPVEDKPAPRQEKKKATAAQQLPKKNHVLRNVLIFLLVTLGVGLLVRGTVFTIRAAKVSGNVRMTQEEVLAEAGIALGQNMFDLDETAVERRVNANRYLSFQRLRRDWPDGVTLFIEERVPSAYAKAYGMLYVLAGDGTVLEESGDIDAPPSLPEVRGLQEGTVTVGRKIASEGSRKLTVYRTLIEEMSLQGCLEQVSVLNLTDMENLMLVTIDGYTVELGESTDLRAKLGAMRAVRLKLLELGKEEGTINVATDPIHPTYMP